MMGRGGFASISGTRIKNRGGKWGPENRGRAFGPRPAEPIPSSCPRSAGGSALVTSRPARP